MAEGLEGVVYGEGTLIRIGKDWSWEGKEARTENKLQKYCLLCQCQVQHCDLNHRSVIVSDYEKY